MNLPRVAHPKRQPLDHDRHSSVQNLQVVTGSMVAKSGQYREIAYRAVC